MTYDIDGKAKKLESTESVLLLVAGLNFAALLCWLFLNVERPIVEKPD